MTDILGHRKYIPFHFRHKDLPVGHWKDIRGDNAEQMLSANSTAIIILLALFNR